MPIYLLNDQGDTIYKDDLGQVFTKVGTRNDVQPNATWTSNDKLHLVGFSYGSSVPDPQGRINYTAEEMAVAENFYYANIDNPIYSDWYDMFASAPVSGVLRVFEYTPAGGANAELRVNGAVVLTQIDSGSAPTGTIRNVNAPAYNVAAGERVEMRTMKLSTTSPTQFLRAGIIPFTYP